MKILYTSIILIATSSISYAEQQPDIQGDIMKTVVLSGADLNYWPDEFNNSGRVTIISSALELAEINTNNEQTFRSAKDYKLASCWQTGKIHDQKMRLLYLYADIKSKKVIAEQPIEYSCSFESGNIQKYLEELVLPQSGDCDGSQMKDYVYYTISAGKSFMRNIKDFGLNRAVKLDMNPNFSYYQASNYVRVHDLYLKNQGCKRLINGPTKKDLAQLKDVVYRIEKSQNDAMSQSGLITGPYGVLP